MDLEFAGGANLPKLPASPHGSVRELKKLVLQRPATHLDLKVQPVEGGSLDLEQRLLEIQESLGKAKPPVIQPPSLVDLRKELLKLRSSLSTSGLVDVDLPPPSYVPVEGDNPNQVYQAKVAEAQTANADRAAQAIIKAIQEGSVFQQAAIHEMAKPIKQGLENTQELLAAVYNRKQGPEDKFQKSLLAIQFEHLSAQQEMLAVVRQSSLVQYEQLRRITQNTSLSDIVKATKQQRDLVRTEQEVFDLKKALFTGHLEDRLKNVNEAVMGRVADGVVRGATNVKNKVLSTKYAQDRISDFKTGKQRYTDVKGQSGHLKAIEDLVRQMAGGAKDRVLSAPKNLFEGLKQLGKSLKKSDEDGTRPAFKFLKESAFKPLLRGGMAFAKGTASAVKDSVDLGLKELYGMNDSQIAHLTAMSTSKTIPDHLTIINNSILDILNKMDYCCKPSKNRTLDGEGKGRPEMGKVIKLTNPPSAIAQPQSPKLPPPPLAAGIQALVVGSRPASTKNAIAVSKPRESIEVTGLPNAPREVVKLVAPKVPALPAPTPPLSPAAVTPQSAPARLSLPAPKVNKLPVIRSTNASSTTVNMGDGVPKFKLDLGVESGKDYIHFTKDNLKQQLTELLDNHTSKTSKSIASLTGRLTPFKTRLTSLAEYRAEMKGLGIIHPKVNLTPLETLQTQLATEQIAMLAAMVKQGKLTNRHLKNLGVLGGEGAESKGGLFGSLGGGLAGRGALPILARLLSLAATPAGMLVIGSLIAYFGKDTVKAAVGDASEFLKDSVSKLKTDISESVTGTAHNLNDSVQGFFGIETDHAKEMAAKRQDATKYGEQGASPTQQVRDQTRSDTWRAIGRGPLGIYDMLTGAAYDHSGDVTEAEIDGGEEAEVVDSVETPPDSNKGTKAYVGKLSNAQGDAYYLPDITDYSFIDGKPAAVKRIANLNRATRGNFLGMAFEYNKLTGNKLFVNSTYRTRAEQEKEYRINPNKAAPPGTSMHEFKLAIDLSVSRNKFLAHCEELGLMRKYGFWRPIKGELWHIEAIGIHPYFGKIKRGEVDENTLERAIMGGRGYGGGGPPLSKGYKSRSEELYRLIISGGRAITTAKEASSAPVTAGGPKGDGSQTTQLAEGKGGAAGNKTPLVLMSAKDGQGAKGATGATGTSGTGGEEIYYEGQGQGPYTGDKAKKVDAKASDSDSGGGEYDYGQNRGKTSSSTTGSIKDSDSLKDKERKSIDKLQGMGWNKPAAIGIVANLKQESQLDHKAVNMSDPKHPAVGIGQWRGSRKTEFVNLYGKKIEEASFDEQLAYVNHELTKGSDVGAKRAGRMLKEVTTPEKAAEIFVRYYERPGNMDEEIRKRGDISTKLAASYGGGNPTQVATTQPSPSMPSPKASAAIETQARAQKAAPVADSGFMKASYSPPEPSQQSAPPVVAARSPAPPPQPMVFDAPEVKGVLEQSYRVQVDMLAELKKLTGMATSSPAKPQPIPSSTPVATPAAEYTSAPVKSATPPSRTNTVYNKDTVGVSI